MGSWERPRRPDWREVWACTFDEDPGEWGGCGRSLVAKLAEVAKKPEDKIKESREIIKRLRDAEKNNNKVHFGPGGKT